MYNLNMAYIRIKRVEECQIWDKVVHIGPIQVHVPPLGLMLHQDQSQRLEDASGMPSGLQNPLENTKIHKIHSNLIKIQQIPPTIIGI